MNKQIIIIVLILTTIFLAACTPADNSIPINESTICTMDYTPVCGTANIECIETSCEEEITYGNACMAESAGATILYEGECEAEQAEELKICTREYNPQCGIDGVTYSNPCTAGDIEIDYVGECQKTTQELSCEDNNGTWLAQYNECEGISKNICTELGGNFNECASACRNNPTARMCTMQCVLVCQFN